MYFYNLTVSLSVRRLPPLSTTGPKKRDINKRRSRAEALSQVWRILSFYYFVISFFYRVSRDTALYLAHFRWVICTIRINASRSLINILIYRYIFMTDYRFRHRFCVSLSRAQKVERVTEPRNSNRKLATPRWRRVRLKTMAQQESENCANKEASHDPNVSSPVDVDARASAQEEKG